MVATGSPQEAAATFSYVCYLLLNECCTKVTQLFFLSKLFGPDKVVSSLGCFTNRSIYILRAPLHQTVGWSPERKSLVRPKRIFFWQSPFRQNATNTKDPSFIDNHVSRSLRHQLVLDWLKTISKVQSIFEAWKIRGKYYWIWWCKLSFYELIASIFGSNPLPP